MKRYSILPALLCWALLAKSQSVWYVDAGANGANTGLSWFNAFTDLHTALAAAQPGDAVWVAAGTYRPDPGNDRGRYFVLKSGVKLYGGFNGTETSLAQRNLNANITELSGNIGNPADDTDNSYTILYLPYPDTATRVDGFTLRDGYAHSDTTFFNFSPVLSGAAVYVQAQNGIGLSLFAHCIFLNNSAQAYGGAVFVNGQNTQGSTPVFQYCEFRNNKAQIHGGAIYITGGNNYDRGVEFDHCQFIDNQAITYFTSQAGGIYWKKEIGNEEVINFVGCTANNNVGQAVAGFMSLWFDVDKVSVTIDSSHFDQNFSADQTSILSMNSFSTIAQKVFKVSNSIISNHAKPVFLVEGNLDDALVDTFIYHNNIFTGNVGGLDGFGYLLMTGNVFYDNADFACNSYGETAIVSNNRLQENKAQGWIFNLNADRVQLDGNLFLNNQIALLLASYSAGLVTHGLQNGFFTDTTRIYNNLMLNNFIEGGVQAPFSSSVSIVENNIVFNNRGALSIAPFIPLYLAPDSSYLAYNLMDVDCSQAYTLNQCGPGNLVVSDPLFADTAAGDYRLLPCSPGVNAGNDAAVQALGIIADFNGAPRIQDGRVDVGPYESPALTIATPTAIRPACPGQASGAVAFDLANGCPPFAFQWSGANGMGTDTSGLAPGNYTFTLTDQRGKSWIQAITVGESPAVETMDTVTPAGCFNCPDGAISVEITSGLTPFHYQWSDGSMADSLAGILPGAYSLTITDSAGCSSVHSFTVTFDSGLDDQNPPPHAFSIFPNPACETTRLAFERPVEDPAQLQMLTAVGKLAYEASLTDGTARVQLPIGALPPGVYWVVVKTEHWTALERLVKN